ncbi:MAG TPA: CvpA family protein [Balneolaceae bacterium]|nr:CvpA family protein [Balneolaceae bacterium]
MNLLDVCIFIPILYFCYRGARNGLIGEILSIVGIILAVFLTFHFMDPLAEYIHTFMNSNPNYLPFIAAALIFIGTLITLQIIAFLLRRFLEKIRFNTINRILGFFFGLLKGGIIVSVVLLLLAGFNQPSKKARDGSVSYSYVIYLAPWAYDAVATKNFSQTINQTLRKYTPIKNFPITD